MEAKPIAVPISSPWRATLLEAVRGTQQQLFIICPYIKDEVITALKNALLGSQERRTALLRVRVLTRVRAEELLNGSSDISALQQLLRWPLELARCAVELRAIDNVHAKVWICDTTQAIVGSGNATPSGLDENLEYGLAVTDQQVIAQICQDWELWWEQAPVVNEQQLEQMQDWLYRSSQLLQEVENTRREIVRTVGPSPRVGQRLSPRSHHLPASQPITPPPAPGLLTENRQAYTPPETITVSHAYLLAALRWVYPFPLGEITPQVAPLAQEFIKLAWNKDAQQLTFTWANGQRRSDASIPARAGGTGASWAIIINLSSAQSLTHDLVALNKITGWGGSTRQATQLSLSSFGPNWSLEVQLNSTLVSHFSVTQTNPPPSFPHLQPPLSRLIGIEHQALQDMFARHPASASTIWLRLASAGSSVSLTFSANSPENSDHFTITVPQGQLAGPPLALQLASADLQQALLGAPNTVTRWSIEIDRNAEAIQLVPEVDDGIISAWRHHLWHIDG